ncbi:GIY-YIG nuclease family protein [Candidatus Entotheonella palauensis]|uniref:GIY-YIG nuclease family protein n=1 Tax=Candidatus Entotheonella palauensis TaxID=93172 RepID=UPI0015C4E28F|nr:GIY-YIG nuclease family protein [Candidatus Entotheonella palauensis]
MNPCTNLCRTLNTIPSAQGGTYVVVLWLGAACEAQIGRLGIVRFPRGYYIYAGSVKGGLAMRLHRHVHGASTRHWHIDYLRPQTRILAWSAFAGPHYPECALAQTLLLRGDVVCPRFGASDCSCPAHLVYYPHRVDVVQALQQLAAPTASESPLADLTQPAYWYGGTRAGFPLVQTIGERDHAVHQNARVR